MRSTYVLHVKRHRVALFVLVACVVLRVFQASALLRGLYGPASEFDAYITTNSVDSAAFFFIPLFCLTRLRPMRFCSSAQCAVALGSRIKLALFCWFDCLICGVVAACILQVLSAAALCAVYGPAYVLHALRLADLLLQGVVLANVGLVCSVVMYTTRLLSVACLGGILYGMWDFMALNTVGGRLPSIGWSLALLPNTASFSDVAFRAGLLGAIFFALGAVLLVATGRAQFFGSDRLSNKT